MEEQFLNIIENFKNQKILVVGDLMLDQYLIGSVERISHEAPIPILDVKEINQRPGGAANTAYNIQSLGGKVFLAGVVGADENGVLLKTLLDEKGIDTTGIAVDSQRKTTLKTRAVAKNQHIVRIDIEDKKPIRSEIEEKLLSFIGSQIKNLNAVIISDYAKGVVTPNLARRLIALAKDNNVLSFVDPKGTEPSKYHGCNIIAPNKQELGALLNIPVERLAQEGRFCQAGKMLLANMMSDNVVVKCSGEGLVVFEKNGNPFRYPAVNKMPVDVSGAGDTAIAVFALALSSGADFKKAIILSSHACGVSVGKPGTTVVLPEELKASLADYVNPNQN